MAKKEKLYTLTEVSKLAGVSMPTLQRYKKQYQDRIPSVGEGRRQRYPKRAIAAVKKLKAENLKKKGRPRKSAARKKAKARPRADAKGLLTLSEIGRRTGISYPTLVRYVKLFIDQIPHEGEGRKRRFPPAAVKVFAKLRKNSKRGRPKGGATRSGGGRPRAASSTHPELSKRIRELERTQAQVSSQLAAVIALLKRPVQVTIRPE